MRRDKNSDVWAGELYIRMELVWFGHSIAKCGKNAFFNSFSIHCIHFNGE